MLTFYKEVITYENHDLQTTGRIEKFRAEPFEEMAKLSKKHGMEMAEKLMPNT